nr:MAG TPA: Transcription initiation factor IIE, alpha FINGER, Transcription [Caudoviricetes sp.]
MEIIKRYQPLPETKRLTCDGCGSVFKFYKSECDKVDYVAVIHDGLGCYSIKCPVCGKRSYFDWK